MKRFLENQSVEMQREKVVKHILPLPLRQLLRHINVHHIPILSNIGKYTFHTSLISNLKNGVDNTFLNLFTLLVMYLHEIEIECTLMFLPVNEGGFSCRMISN